MSYFQDWSHVLWTSFLMTAGIIVENEPKGGDDFFQDCREFISKGSWQIGSEMETKIYDRPTPSADEVWYGRCSQKEGVRCIYGLAAAPFPPFIVSCLHFLQSLSLSYSSSSFLSLPILSVFLFVFFIFFLSSSLSSPSVMCPFFTFLSLSFSLHTSFSLRSLFDCVWLCLTLFAVG